MKNLIRFFGFAVALFAATSLSAQYVAPTGSKGTDTGGGGTTTTSPTAASSQTFNSTMDNAVVDILQGATATVTVYVQKVPGGEFFLSEVRHNVMGTASPEDVVINQPDSAGLRIIVSSSKSSNYTVSFM